MPHLRIDGADLHYEDTRQGEQAIVFSHGLLWDARMYDAQVAHLRGRYRCIAYDHRGQGESSAPGPYDMERLADDAVALIEALSAAPCHFVGLSMGGFVGLRLAARRPELLRSLVLVESAADPEPRWNVPRYRAMEWLGRHLGYGVLLGRIMKIMFGPAFLRDPSCAEARRRAEESLLALDPERTGLALDAVVRRRGVEDLLPRIRVPTLVLHGTDDAAIRPARARRTFERIPGARWEDVPGAGHTSVVERPAAVNAALDGFLGSLPRAPEQRA
jgi:pimeloyl-ACP methyl ester carboxylesterase